MMGPNDNWPKHVELTDWPTQEEVRRVSRRAFWFDVFVNVFAVVGAVAVIYVLYVEVQA